MHTHLSTTFVLGLAIQAGLSHAEMTRTRTPFTRAVASTATTSLDTSGATMIQLFEWPWKSVQDECPNLAKWGYTHVQVSTPNEHTIGNQWWTSYSPTSYKLISKRGDEAALRSMVTACSNAGISVITDIITNHMSDLVLNIKSDGYGRGFAGSSYKKYEYPGLYTESNFHTCRTQITNYQDINNVQTCQLSNLPDLAQEQSAVSTKLKAFLQSLVDIGIVGFRVDAAKHIPTNLVGSIFGGLSKPVLLSQETIGGKGDPVGLRPGDYAKNGLIQELVATWDLKRMFTTDGIGYMANWGESWNYDASKDVNVFVANHDTDRNGDSLTPKSANNAYKLANIFLLGWNYGFPTVYSGYDWTNKDIGAPQNAQGYTNAVTCGSNGWRCDHRSNEFKNMAMFRKKAAGKKVTNTVKGNNQQLGFGRENVGYVAINNSGGAWQTTFKTGLAAGSYCNILATDNIASCSSKIQVGSDGSFSTSIPAYSAVALLKA